VVRAKHLLRQLGIKRLDMQDGFAVLQFAQPERLNLKHLIKELQHRPDSLRLTPDHYLKVRLPEAGLPLERLQNCLKEVATFVNPEEED
jgi:transcription-repair coupling factor (superfamily II helicase)